MPIDPSKVQWAAPAAPKLDASKVEWDKPKAPDIGFFGAASRGFQRSLPETKSLLAGAGAAVAGAVGADRLRDAALDKYQQIQREEVDPLASQSGFQSSLKGDTSFGEWAGDTLGNFGGQALQSLAAAGAGALVGSSVPGAGTAAGAVGGLVARGAVKKGVDAAAKRMLADQLAKGATREAAEAAAKTAAQRQLQRIGGAAVAPTLFNVGQETGIAYGDRATDAAAAGEQLTQADALRAMAYGVPAGLLDTAAEAFGVGRVLKGGGAGSLPSRVVRGAAGGAVIEGGTEGAQAVLERAGAGRPVTGDDATHDYIENIAAGALGGGVMHGAGSARQTPKAPPLPEPQPPPAPPPPVLGLPKPDTVVVDSAGNAVPNSPVPPRDFTGAGRTLGGAGSINQAPGPRVVDGVVIDPAAGPISRAAVSMADKLSPAVDAEFRVLNAPALPAPTMIAGPDGSVGSEADRFNAAQQAAALGLTPDVLRAQQNRTRQPSLAPVTQESPDGRGQVQPADAVGAAGPVADIGAAVAPGAKLDPVSGAMGDAVAPAAAAQSAELQPTDSAAPAVAPISTDVPAIDGQPDASLAAAEPNDYRPRLVELRRVGRERTPEQTAEYVDILEQDRTTTKVGGEPIIGVRNFTAYTDAEQDGSRKPFVLISDADNFKSINDTYGHEFGDQVIRVIGETMRDAMAEIQADAYHRSGDEFLAAGDDPAALAAAAQLANERLAGTTIELGLPGGGVVQRAGVQFSFGVGSNANEAEENLRADKQARAAAGLRTERGTDRRLAARRDADAVDAPAPVPAVEGRAPAGESASDPAAALSPPQGELPAEQQPQTPADAGVSVSGPDAGAAVAVETAAPAEPAPAPDASIATVPELQAARSIVETGAFAKAITTERDGRSTKVFHNGKQIASVEGRPTRPQLLKALDKSIAAQQADEGSGDAQLPAAETGGEPGSRAREKTVGDQPTTSSLADTEAAAAAEVVPTADAPVGQFSRAPAQNSEGPGARGPGRVQFPTGARGRSPAQSVSQSDGMSNAAVQKIVDQAKADWNGRAAPRVRVVADAEALPADAKRDPGYRLAEGYYDGSTVWLVAANLSSPQRAAQVLAHEAIGHFGVERIIGLDQWKQIAESLVAMERDGRGSAAMRQLLREVRARYGNVDADGFAREAIAVMAERGIRNSVMDRVIAAVRAFLRKFMPDAKWSEAELRQLLVRGERLLRKGESQQERVARVAAMSFSQGGAVDAPAFQRGPAADDQTQTPEFRRWFDPDGLADDEGAPRRFFHSGSAEFSEVNPAIGRFGGIFVLPDKPADYGEATFPLYVRGPIASTRDIREFSDAAEDGGLSIVEQAIGRSVPEDDLSAILDGVVEESAGSEFMDAIGEQEEADAYAMMQKIRGQMANAAGYRGVKIHDEFDGEAILIVDPSAVKSATGNRGTFDPDNADIRFSRKDATETPAFRNWFSGSKVTDADGRPRVVYHGTSDEFTVFRNDKLGSNTGHATAPFGFYFTTDKRQAEHYAQKGSDGVPMFERVVDVYLAIRNPYVMTLEEAQAFETRAESEAFRRWVAAQGYDGIRVGDDTWIAFEPGQIKSASENVGTFDGASPDIRFSQPIPGWIAGQSPAAQEALRKAGVWYQPPKLRDRVKAWAKDWQKRVRQGLVDQFEPIRQYDYKAYMLARMTRGADAALEAVMNYGTIRLDADGAVDVDFDKGGFIGVLSKLGNEHDRFLGWVIGNRAGRLLAEGREHNFTPADIAELKALASGTMPDGRDRSAAYREALADLNRYNKAVMDIAERAGLIDGESRSVWEQDFYVPFYRLMEGDDAAKGPTRSAGMLRQYAFKSLKGGTEALGDPVHNILRNWSHLIDASLKNQAAVAAMKAAAKVGAVQPASAEDKGAVFVMEGGRKAHYLIDDPFLLDAVGAIGFTGFGGPAMKFMSATKRLLTTGVTISPTFRIRNVIRDSLSMIGTNPANYNVLDNLVTGWAGTREGTETFGSLLAGGGVMRYGTLLEGDRAEHVKRLIESGVPKDTILNSEARIRAALRKAWDWWAHVGDRAENINRAALYKKLRADGKTHLEASFAARDVMDFSMQGTWAAVRFLAQTVPFFNARLQGMYKLGRGAAEDPRRFGAVLGATAMASIALLLAYRDDEDWKAREDWDRETFWWFKIGDQAYRIPKPFEIGVLATMAERGLETLVTDDLTGREFGERVFAMVSENLSMNPIPQVAKPMIELYANRNMFTDRPIETMGMERLSKAERIAPHTSATAQLLGKAGVLSPVQIDHVVHGYTGWLGSHAVALADLALRPAMNLPGKPAFRADDVLVVGDFVKNLPAQQSRYVTRFYDQAKEVEQVMADLRHFQRIGALEEARELLANERGKVALAPIYRHAARQMTDLNEQIRAVQRSDASAEAKRARIDQLYALRNRLAQLIETRARSAATP